MIIPDWLDGIDPRIGNYIRYIRDNSEGENDCNNLTMVATACRFLRMCNVYTFDSQHVKRYIKMAESFELDSLDGKRKYPITDAQAFIIAAMHGFLRDVELDLYGSIVKEQRKVVQDVILFVARKFGKTQIDAWEALDDFLFGENDSEVHIVSNSLDQSLIAYRAIKDMLVQIDPKGTQIRVTQKEITWKTGRRATIYPHTAGGKRKDGAKASKVLGDEYGSSAYVKDRSDMSDALEVYLSSMGTRKNPFSIITTTAGKVVNGPFEMKMNGVVARLIETELDADPEERMDYDHEFIYSGCPDSWERSDEYYGLPRIWKKCNYHTGITIQPGFYEQEWMKAKGDPEHYKETVTKLFNQFVSNSSRPWITAEDIRRLTHPTITNVRQLTQDWLCFVGCDFSKGDDLCSLSYNCFNPETGQYYFDCDVWIAREQMAKNSNYALYEMWDKQGFLHVSDGRTIDEGDVLAKLDEVNNHVRIVCIGYDPYDSTKFVNLFQAWLVGKMHGKSRKFIEDALKLYLQPVSQSWASFNSPVQVMWDIVMRQPQIVFVSNNPLIPWNFANCRIELDRMENAKPVKLVGTSAKIDIVISLLMGIIMQERFKR